MDEAAAEYAPSRSWIRAACRRACGGEGTRRRERRPRWCQVCVCQCPCVHPSHACRWHQHFSQPKKRRTHLVKLGQLEDGLEIVERPVGMTESEVGGTSFVEVELEGGFNAVSQSVRSPRLDLRNRRCRLPHGQVSSLPSSL